MKLRVLLALIVFAAALPALAAPACLPPQVVSGNNCALSFAAGWAAADLGTQSILTTYVPLKASGPVTFRVTGLSSSLGSAYTGYFAIMIGSPGQPYAPATLSDFIAQPDKPRPPGKLNQAFGTKVCWDPTCTAAAPAGAVPNMFSLQGVMLSPNPADLTLDDVQLTIQFLNGSQVTFEETENAQTSGPNVSYYSRHQSGSHAGRALVYNGAAVTLPFDAISVSNLNNPAPITGTVSIQDRNSNTIATANIPAIPPGGAAGYLVIGRFPGDPLGLFPSNTVLPVDPPTDTTGVFRGVLTVTMNGPSIVLAQEYNGNAMLNLLVLH